LFKLRLPLRLKNVYELKENFCGLRRRFPQRDRSMGQERNISEDEIEKVKRIFYQKGFERGKKEGEATIFPLKKMLSQAINELKREKKNFLEKSEKAVVEIALAIAKKIIKREVSSDPEITKRIIEEALRRIKDPRSGKIIIKVNPNDWEILTHTDELFPLNLAEGEVKIEKDGSIQSGGCIVETEGEIINASIENQLEEISRALKEEKE